MLTPSKRALIVIDLQNDYFPGGLFPLWNTEETLRNVVAAIGKARALGIPVIHVQHVANAVLHMASLPLDVNVLFMTVMATKMPFVGRG